MRSSRFLFLFFLLVSITAVSLPANADTVDRLYEKAAKKYHTLYKDINFRKHAENWLKTIKQFQFIVSNHPKHQQAPKALFSIGKLYRSLFQLNKKDIYLDRSSISFRKLVKEYPHSSLADDAQFLLGENYEVFVNNRDLAIEEYKKVVELYPNRLSAKKARKKLQSLQTETNPVQIEPNIQKAATPEDLTKARFGGVEKWVSEQNGSVQVTDVQYWSTPEWSRMVINIKGQVRYKYQVLKEDKTHRHKRLYIDFYKTFITRGFKNKIAANDGLISQARIAQYNKETVRVVLDMESLDKIKVFHFSLPNQYKVVVDIIGKSQIAAVKEPDLPKTTTTDVQQRENEFQSLTLSKVLGLKVKTIIIDPGHGGKDPGAIAGGVQEKDLALRIAINLKRILRKKHPDVHVLMTRTTDKFVELEARTAFANKHKGDLFISIHVNASTRKTLNGIETYYLNLTTDEDALALAAKENQTSLESISEIQSILYDLMVNTKINDSKELAGKVQYSLIGVTDKSTYKMNDLGVKKAPFRVLIGAQMPSILVEAGFITNAADRKRLNTVSYRKTIAMGIYQGLTSYLN